MKQGEVWLVDLNPTIGAEITKRRPCIIINVDHLGKLPLKIVVPITDWKERYTIAPWMVKVVPNKSNNLTKDSSADCFQVRSIADERFIKHMGFVDQNIVENIQEALSMVFGIE